MNIRRAITERRGVKAVEEAFLKFGWLPREQTVLDFGIDATVEIAENDVPTGRMFAVQIKSGESYFKKRGEDFVFYGEARHLDYWTGHALPVFILMHNPADGMILWQKVDRDAVTICENGRWSIPTPKNQKLDEASKPYIKNSIPKDLRAFRRLRLTLDLPLIRQVAEQNTYMSLEHWLHKGLSHRNPKIWFGEPNARPPDWEEMSWMALDSIAEFIGIRFPWLDFEYVGPVNEIGCEVEVHNLLVTVNEIGAAALTLDEFYDDGYEMPDAPEPPEADDDFDYDNAHMTWGD